MPLAAKKFAAQHRYAAVVCLGCVIRGETPHFEYVCGEAARGCTLVSLETGVPVAFGVITADTLDQAQARAFHEPLSPRRQGGARGTGKNHAGGHHHEPDVPA